MLKFWRLEKFFFAASSEKKMSRFEAVDDVFARDPLCDNFLVYDTPLLCRKNGGFFLNF